MIGVMIVVAAVTEVAIVVGVPLEAFLVAGAAVRLALAEVDLAALVDRVASVHQEVAVIAVVVIEAVEVEADSTLKLC